MQALSSRPALASESTSDLQVCHFQSPLGWLSLTTSPQGVRALDYLTCGPDNIRQADTPLERQVAETLERYFAGNPVDFQTIPMDLGDATPFQQAAWRKLREIPHGQVRSYQWMAEALGSPKAMRAIGQANRRNPVPILIPCHRVIAKNGTLGGYMGGAEKGLTIKRFLLSLEGVQF